MLSISENVVSDFGPARQEVDAARAAFEKLGIGPEDVDVIQKRSGVTW